MLTYQTFLLNETFFSFSCFDCIMGGFFIFFTNVGVVSCPLVFFEWLSLFVYLMIHCYLFFILDDYNRVPICFLCDLFFHCFTS